MEIFLFIFYFFAEIFFISLGLSHAFDNFVFLYSGLNEVVKNSITYLAIFSKEKLITDDFFYAQKIIKNSSLRDYN